MISRLVTAERGEVTIKVESVEEGFLHDWINYTLIDNPSQLNITALRNRSDKSNFEPVIGKVYKLAIAQTDENPFTFFWGDSHPFIVDHVVDSGK